MRKILLLIGILLALGVQAQNKALIKYSKTITASDLEKHLKIIASDEYQGRGTGEKGLDMAADYISKEFKGDNLAGPVKESGNPYFQEFELEKKTWTKMELSSGSENLQNNKDFIFFDAPEGQSEYEVVFVGYGIHSDKYSDYNNVDVKGKIVAFMLGEPLGKDGNYLATGTTSPSIKKDTTIEAKFEQLQPKAMASFMRGAKGFIIIDESDADAEKTIGVIKKLMGGPQISLPGGKSAQPTFPVFFMSPGQATRMFGSNLQALRKRMEDSLSIGHSPSGIMAAKIKLDAVKTTEMINTKNVVGYIEGNKLKDELLVICGHYDHLGVKEGEIYNGADDNGSGTVGLLEMAEAFSMAKANKKGPQRSILFIAVTGEEKGLLGSKYYAANPVYSLTNTVTALNIDMLGRVDKEHADSSNYIYLIGSDYMSSDLHKLSEETAKIYTPELRIDYTYNAKDHPESLYYRSDQISFAEKGVPVIFYTSGMHDDYHMPGDDVDKIDFNVLEKRLKLVFATAWELANRPERVIVDKK
jgi:hypothetical protein